MTRRSTNNATNSKDEERERLNTLIRAGKHAARQLTKARILLKADASETGEGWRDCEIAAALDTSVDTVARTRQQLSMPALEQETIALVPTRGGVDADPVASRTLRSAMLLRCWRDCGDAATATVIPIS
jgi:hypothetical protein